MGGRRVTEYGAMVEWYWQGKTEVLGEKHDTVWVVDEWMSMEQWWNVIRQSKTEVLLVLLVSTTCPTATPFLTNLIFAPRGAEQQLTSLELSPIAP